MPVRDLLAPLAQRPEESALLFDVDGTLYCQPPLRSAMAVELVSLPVARDVRGAGATWTTLRAFRHVREELRALGRPDAPLEDLQYRETAARAGVSAT